MADYASTLRAAAFHFSRRPSRRDCIAMHRTMFVACPASTGALGSLRERMHSRKLRTCAGAARLKLPVLCRLTLGFMSTAVDCGHKVVGLAADVKPSLCSVELLELIVGRVVRHRLVSERECREVVLRELDQNRCRVW